MFTNRLRTSKINTVLILFVILFSVSCSTPLRKVTYLNGINSNQKYQNGPLPDVYRIRPNDQLFIQVISDDPANAAFLNLTQSQISNVSGGSMELITYLVNEDGIIEYPYIGQISVEGLTVLEVNEKIQEKVDEYLENASVFVKLVNRNVTVLGEVSSPGQITMIKNQLTIFEALGAAGDITDYGNRQNIKIIRELPDGKEIAELDLTDPNIIFSPYYYILPHDIVYVENSTKIYGAKNMPYAAPLSIAASILSLALLTLNLLK